MAVEVISTTASVGCSMTGSGTSSTRTSSVPCHVTARTASPVSVASSRSSADAVAELALVEAEEALLVGTDLGDGHLVEARVGVGRNVATYRSGSGPQGLSSVASSTLTRDAACSKCAGVGRSWWSCPGTPLVGHSSCASLRADSSSSPQHALNPA